MLERLKWTVLALAQPAEIQESLFPEYVGAAEELALCWEEALGELESGKAKVNLYQRGKIEELDRLILAISGPEKLELWFDEDSLSKFTEWVQIRSAAIEVAKAFGWPIITPPPSRDIYIRAP